MDFLYNVSVDPILQIVEDPVFFIQVVAEGLMAGVMYSLVALGFCLIYKASGVFNFAQGIFIVFAVLLILNGAEEAFIWCIVIGLRQVRLLCVVICRYLQLFVVICRYLQSFVVICR